MSTPRTVRRMLATLLAAGMVLAACGDDEGASDASSATAEATASETADASSATEPTPTEPTEAPVATTEPPSVSIDQLPIEGSKK